MKKLTTAIAAVTTIGLVAGCTTEGADGNGGTGGNGGPALELASSEVIDRTDGIGTSERIFESAPRVVVSSPELSDQLRAASIAVASGLPMLVDTGDNQEDLQAEIDRLGADEAVTVGQVGEIDGIDTVDGAGTGRSVEARQITEEEAVEAVATLDPEDPRLLSLDPAVEAGLPELDRYEQPLALPPVLVSPESGLASVATARAAGAEVTALAVADPRVTGESMELVNNQDVLALGPAFGTDEEFSVLVDYAANGELPGGGGLLFPGRRMIAFYGHPSGSALGVMGEQPPAEAVARVEEHIENYQPIGDQPVVPAFEIIVTVASEFPGEDGKYTNIGDPEQFIGYIDAITEAGGYAFLDLQPGQSSFLEQAKVYEELLKRPNVGLALDPEWNLQPGERPLQRVGHAEAWEINEVSEWLAELVRENNLPQKGLIVHQFQMQMLRDRDQIKTDHPEISFILHADGHGVPDEKFATWDAVRNGLSDDWHMAWKNFIDEDSPMFTPEQTYDIEPRPWFVSYQ